MSRFCVNEAASTFGRALIMVNLCFLSACGSDGGSEAAVSDAILSSYRLDTPTRLVLTGTHDGCAERAVAVAQETKAQVTVRVPISFPASGEADCNASAVEFTTTVELEESLGSRRVISASTGREIKPDASAN